jgi:L,D-peptidoglycan transpeptidase YkuD (ErfK/YbiS/YcfS/YnhG family)
VRQVKALLLGGVTAALLVAGPGVAAAAAPVVLPAELSTLPPGTGQLLVVSTPRPTDTVATLSAYEFVDGAWRVAFPAMRARIGGRGFSDHKHEGDRTTPTGLYTIGGTMYGILPNPGVHYTYHRLVKGDYWNENARTRGYNTFQHGKNPGGPSEALWRISPQYQYFAVINYNVPVVRRTPARGSGVFLHEMVAGHTTAGCVALARGDLVKVLTWLDPTAAPRIALGPEARLRTL